MSKSKIEWTESTWNPISGCTKISAGCANCYAETMANRLKAMGTKGYENGFEVTMHPERLFEPLKRKKPTIYFVCSMGDLFHVSVPFEFIDQIFAIMALTPQHTYQILTKRPERMREYLTTKDGEIDSINTTLMIAGYEKVEVPLPNVWLGVTAENQEQADKRIPILLDIPAALRFVSIEPMLGHINLVKNKLVDKSGRYAFPCLSEEFRTKWIDLLDWVICGGETGAGARPVQYEWVKDLQSQCRNAMDGTVPFFFKKCGKIAWYKGEARSNPALF